MNVRRVPLESTRPLEWFAALRVAIVAVTLGALATFDVPHREELIVLGAVAAVLALGVLVLSDRAPALALSPLVALVDLLVLAVAEAIAPDSYGAVRFLALFLVAAHAHFQGGVRGVAIAAAAVIMLVPIAVLGDAPVGGPVLAFYETLFAAAALAAGLFMGRLRTAESTGRLRARELSRRVLEAESKMRRRLAEEIHDGPVQELVSLDMMLDTARRAVERGDNVRATEVLHEARALAERNVGSLREEIVSLGPYAFDELSLGTAIERCAPVWSRRYGVPVQLELAELELSNELCGCLFGIAQEAVANAGRHAQATAVTVIVSRTGDRVELRVADDGRGFDGGDRFTGDAPGHIGLASMRERAELAGGDLRIETGENGTTVIASAPLTARNGSAGR